MALKIACGQIEIIAGRPDLNTKKILHHMDMACQNGIDILLLPELAVPGYFLGDLWEQTAFIEDCAAYGDEIIAATENCGELCVIFGNIAVDNSKRNEDGRARKYNAAFAAQHGRLLTNGTLPYDFIVKNALPNYRELMTTVIFTAYGSWLWNWTNKLPGCTSRSLSPPTAKPSNWA